MKKKLFGILLTLCLVVCAFAISASAEATTISSAEELVNLMNTSSMWSGDYILGDNIDLDGQTQTPIGNATTKFTGTFDGDGHTITGVDITTATSYTGLFGCVEGGTVKNLTVYGAVESTAGKYIGGIVGWSRGITMENCHNYVNVTGASESVGGVLGYIYYNKANVTSSITNCTNHGTVNGSAYSGGIVGDIFTEKTYSGLSVTIDGCKNYGVVTTSGNVAGGIVGYIRLRTTTAANVSETTVKNCANYALITAADYAGGLIGAALTDKTFYAKLTFSNLYNEGDIVVTSSSTTSYATPFAGGFIALLRPSLLLDSSASTELPFTISDIYNKGTVYRTKVGGTSLGGAVIGTLGVAKETVTLTLNNVCNANGETIILSAPDFVNSTDGVLVYNNQATAVTTLTTVYGSNNYVSTSTEDEFNALAAEDLWLTGWNSPELASFHNHTYVDGTCACGAVSAVTLDSYIDSVDEYMLLVNDSEAWSGTYYLTTNLDLTGYSLTPIGNATTAFTGSFDGQGNTISGFNISGKGTTSTEGIGLFGVISSGATIKNLKVSGTVSGTETLGGIVGLAITPFTITGCEANVTITNSGARSGGIVGDVAFSDASQTATITDCTVSGSVSVTTGHVGGIVGRMYPTKTSSAVVVTNCTNNAAVTCINSTADQADAGGIIGRLALTKAASGTTVTLSGCVNNGEIKAAGYPIGGVIGEYISLTDYTSNITNCTNNGNVVGSNIYAGGVIGLYNNTSTTGLSSTFTNIKNTGDVKGTTHVGGIIGYFRNLTAKTEVSDTETISEIPDTAITAANLVNYATITGKDFTGGIFGRHENEGELDATQSQSFTNLANYGEINGKSYVGGVIGLSTSKSIPATFDHLYNEGEVNASGSYGGGIFGFLRNYGIDYDTDGNQITSAKHVYVTNCENRGDVTVTTDYAGGISGYFANDGALCMSNTVTTGTLTAPESDNCNAVIGGYAVGTYAHELSGNYYVAGADANGILIEASTTYTDTLLSGETVAWYTDVTNTYAPELIAYHEHIVIATPIDETYHSVTCWCGDESTVIESEEHTNDSAGKCTVCGYSACAHTNSAWVEAEDGTYNFVCDDCDKTVIEGAEKPYIYVDNNGSGDDTFSGIYKEAAVKTLDAAISKMSATGGDVIILSRYTISSDITLPAYEKEITFTTENWSTGFYIAKYGATLNLGGPTVFTKIVFNGSRSSSDGAVDGVYYNILVIAANWNDLTVGPSISSYGVAYIVMGSNDVSVSEKDLEGKTVNLTLYRTNSHAVTETDSEGNTKTLTGAKAFYDRVFLGDRVRTADEYTVKNVNINFIGNNATFNNFYLCTTSVASCDAQMENYTVTATFNGTSDAYINSLHTGDGNTASGTAYIDSLTLNLNGTSYIKTLCEINNVKNLTLNISNGADREDSGATVAGTYRYNLAPVTVNTSEAFDALGLETSVSVSYGTHSFASGVEYPTYSAVYGEVVPTVTDECTWETETTEHTADAIGTKTSTCSVCARTKTEEYHVLSYAGTKWAYDEEAGVYILVCPVCGETLLTSETNIVYVGEGGDDNADGLSADTKVATLTEAVTRLADVGGTVIFNGNVTISETTELPAWSGTILFTSDPDTDDVNAAAQYGIVIGNQNVSFSMGGAAKFNHILIKGTSSLTYRMYLSANWNDIEMGYIRVQEYAQIYLIGGVLYQKVDDTETKSCNMIVDGPAMSDNAGEYYFYERIYLGSIYLADGIEVSNKTVTATFRDGYINSKDTTRDQPLVIGTLYMMSTAGNNSYKTSTTNGCTSTAYINDNTGIYNVRTGDKNVNMSTSAGKVDNVYFYFNDNSNVVDLGDNLGSFCVRNAVNTHIYVSDKDATQAWLGEGVRTKEFAHSIYFQRYGTFTEEATATVTYGTHSFIYSITDPVQNEGDYVVTKVVNNECEDYWDDGVVTEPADGEDGSIVYTCLECGKTKTEVIPAACTTHNKIYLKLEDGTYVCPFCREELGTPTGSMIIALDAGTVKDGEVSVNVVITAEAFAAADFIVTAPDTFTLTGISYTMNDSDGFRLVAPETLTNPAEFVIANFGGEDGALDGEIVVTLNYTVDDSFSGKDIIKVDCVETINAAEEDVETTLVYTEVVHEHTFVKGELVPCDDKTAYYIYNCVCGAYYIEYVEFESFEEDEIIYGLSANVGNNLGMELLIKTTDLFYDASTDTHTGWVVVDVYDKDGNVTSSVVYAHKITQNQTTGIYTYRFNFPDIVAKKMGDKIVSTFYGVVDGVEYKAEPVEKNIQTYYALAQANSDAEGTLMTLLNAMLNYGAAAQTYFGYNTENLVNSVLPDGKQKSTFEADATTKVSSEDTCTNDAYKASGLYAVLEQEVVVSLVLTPTDAVYAQDTLVFVGSYKTIQGKTINVVVNGDDFIVDSDGNITVDVKGISAKDLRQTITGALYHTDGTPLSDTVSFSFECYATEIYESGSQEAKNICAAILEYCDAATTYFVPTATSEQ